MRLTKRAVLNGTGFLCLFACLLLLILWPLGFRYYTTLGIDSDHRDTPARVCYRYYRVRWPGDGSFRIGGGVSYYQLGNKAIEPFDWGGQFFQPPRRDTPRSLFNRLGFWWIQTPSGFWIGVPGVIPALLFAALFLLCRRRLASDKIQAGQKSKNTTASLEC